YGANHHTMPTMTNGKVRSIRLKTLLRVMTSLRYLCGSLVIGHYPKIMELVPDLRRTQFAERVFRAVEGDVMKRRLPRHAVLILSPPRAGQMIAVGRRT